MYFRSGVVKVYKVYRVSALCHVSVAASLHCVAGLSIAPDNFDVCLWWKCYERVLGGIQGMCEHFRGSIVTHGCPLS